MKPTKTIYLPDYPFTRTIIYRGYTITNLYALPDGDTVILPNDQKPGEKTASACGLAEEGIPIMKINKGGEAA